MRLPARRRQHHLGPGGKIGELLTTHPDVDKIAFTGSTEVGKDIMAKASGTLKKVTLECGGKSPNIVLHDADWDIAIDGSIFASFYHQGQVCESGTRLLLPISTTISSADGCQTELAAFGRSARSGDQIGQLCREAI